MARAQVGDQVVVRGDHLDEHVRRGVVVEVHGDGGTPPWVVRWDDDGHESTYVPGPGTTVERPT